MTTNNSAVLNAQTEVDFDISWEKPAPMPEGVYDAEVADVQNYTSAAGNPCQKWILKITDPAYNGRNVTEVVVLSVAGEPRDSNLRRTGRWLHNLGVTPVSGNDKKQAFKASSAALAKGMRCRAQIGQKPSQNDPETIFNTIVAILSPDSIGSKAASSAAKPF